MSMMELRLALCTRASNQNIELKLALRCAPVCVRLLERIGWLRFWYLSFMLPCGKRHRATNAPKIATAISASGVFHHVDLLCIILHSRFTFVSLEHRFQIFLWTVLLRFISLEDNVSSSLMIFV